MLGFVLLSPTYDVALNKDIVDTQFEAASGGKSGHGWPFWCLGAMHPGGHDENQRRSDHG
jgi:hypothetical protein